jgi:hypothetical protein
MIKNELGQTAMVYRQPIPNRIKVGDKIYDFVIKRGIALAWVDEEDIGQIMSVTKSCCGGNKRAAYAFASQGQINVWSGTGR